MTKSNLKKVIRNQDSFGHPISFNFNKNGDSYTTVIGGFISLLIKIALTAYLVVRI